MLVRGGSCWYCSGGGECNLKLKLLVHVCSWCKYVCAGLATLYQDSGSCQVYQELNGITQENVTLYITGRSNYQSRVL